MRGSLFQDLIKFQKEKVSLLIVPLEHFVGFI